MATSTQIHPFTKSGLGEAPFRCVGMHTEQGPRTLPNGLTVGAPGQPMGTCDHCGMGIKYVYDIVSADGNKFGVGCECVLKTARRSDADRIIVEDAAVVREVKRIKRNHDRELRQLRKVEKENARREVARSMAQELLDSDPDFADALETDHYICRDIKSRLFQWGKVSDKQIALVHKIAAQVRDKKAQEESFIEVPRIAGRQTIVGKVVAAKWVEASYGYGAYTSDLKGLVIVDTPEGQWKTWGTIPNSIVDDIVAEDGYSDIEGGVKEAIKGRTIQFDARVKVAPNDPKMSFFSRPSKGVEVK